MTAHSNILAWEIPWTEEPGGLQSGVAEESDVTEQLNNRRRRILEYVMKPSCNLKLFPNWLTSNTASV